MKAHLFFGQTKNPTFKSFSSIYYTNITGSDSAYVNLLVSSSALQLWQILVNSKNANQSINHRMTRTPIMVSKE